MSAAPKTIHQLREKKVVVLGGTSGIGFAVASALIEEGASVVVSSSNPKRVESAVARLSDSQQQYNADASRVSGHALNLSGDCEAALQAFFEQVGTFDHLVYTAGDSLATTPVEKHTYDTLVKSGSVRFFSAVLAVKTAVPHLRKGGSIVLTTGSTGEKPVGPGWAVVSGFAAGLDGLTRGLALELSAQGLRVNCVSPGAVDTELWDGMPEEAMAHLKSEAAKTPTGKFGQPHEIAQAFLYFLKDTNCTGRTHVTESGAHLGNRPGA
ncbi:3-oxoacyl-reductase [Tilletiopsis washingtonensis]|uniref:3-oxoacyl-reductase n=1 Tax=Tilletiopsis washingtonensis TaxID=58919 RepID=A0A316ZBC4_9BASI|nr:3-oxoacyl-reductase [Tilletiopsis washingtonensis]PWN98851.1 3-oxoacyl-reductase [Tilletiopsis washingtonensis]